ncbi:MAG TPA: hypothetical protein PLU52_02360 [Opitutaceae bacterium]|nr:hypothetical protein [Opitutaceae bacterium]HND60102.1 hypothetical protein [Opitutaceae bacterium]
MKSIIRNLLLSSSLALVAVVGLRAEPVNVSYTVTGTSGDYTLNFSITNNISAGQHLYFFGTKLGGAGITASPSGWDPSMWSIWNPTTYGGSGPNINFNNNWIDLSINSGGGLAFGDTLSGFSVHILDAAAPEFVDWFAYSYGDYYQGPFDFNNTYNPGFTNAAHQASAPDAASTLGLLGAAFAGLALLRRRFSK